MFCLPELLLEREIAKSIQKLNSEDKEKMEEVKIDKRAIRIMNAKDRYLFLSVFIAIVFAIALASIWSMVCVLIPIVVEQASRYLTIRSIRGQSLHYQSILFKIVDEQTQNYYKILHSY